jgi:hypothetical protein
MKTAFLFLLPVVVLLGATPTATVFAHNDNQQQQACPRFTARFHSQQQHTSLGDLK